MATVTSIKSKEDLKISSFKRSQVHNIYVHLSDNSLGIPWKVPIILIRGKQKGPILGVTAALHGDELNGISTIFKLINQIDPETLSGTLALVPIANVPGYLTNQRYFLDSVDLNRIMPGAEYGASSNLYAHYFAQKIVSKFDYLLDLHTASQGRVNSLYLRADLENETCRTLAYLQNPHIIVKKDDQPGSLRAWANEQGIPSITVEIGNPSAFQHSLIDETLEGIKNTLIYFGMLQGEVKNLVQDATVCDHSYWIYSKRGGIVDVLVKLTDNVSKGQVIARVYDVFGTVREEIVAKEDGIVIGRNINPKSEAGSRIVHLGVDIFDPHPKNIPAHE